MLRSSSILFDMLRNQRAPSFRHAASPSAALSLFVRVPMLRDESGKLKVGNPYPALERLNAKVALEGNERRDKARKVRALLVIDGSPMRYVVA